jgi:hypothetical protein
MKERVTWFIAAIIYLAILYSLVRPGSKGTILVASITGTLTDLIHGVSGQTFNSKSGQWETGTGKSNG